MTTTPNSTSTPSGQSDYQALLCAVGIDSLYLSAYIDRLCVNWETLRFEQEKLRATQGLEHGVFELGGESFALKRGGSKPYSFILANRDFDLKLGENIKPRCHAQFRSELLWREGLDASFARFNDLWRKAGCRFERPETIFRVDAAFDFAIGEPDFRIGDFVSQAAKDATWRDHGEEQTFMFGNSNVVVRVYNKVAEIEQASDKHWMFDLWGTDEGVWRCEFQVRGERLKEAGISTVEHLKAYLPGLVRDLALKHTSLRRPTGDSNRSRWPRHPMWTALIDAADALTDPPSDPPRPFCRGSLYSIDNQLRSVAGDLKGLAATLSRNAPDRPVSLEQLMVWLPRMLMRRHSPELWAEDVRARILKKRLGL